MQEEAMASPYALLFQALFLIPISHYFFWFLLIFLVFLYNFLEFHFFHDLITGLRGDPVSLTYNACSELYQSVASKCQVLHGRYLATPWLASPHLQTGFLSVFGNPPQFCYKRHLYYTPDGGTIALDWLMHGDVIQGGRHVNVTTQENHKTPIVIVIPGLTSDFTSAYIKHFAIQMAKQGWNVVVSNHRGLGGTAITSDCFYNAGWTEDMRNVIDHIRIQYPEAPLYAVGTSIGANILENLLALIGGTDLDSGGAYCILKVKYLGEEGPDTPLTGAASVCSPWDLLICDRFINRRYVQKLYDRVLAVGLQGYAQLHQLILSRLVDWEGIRKIYNSTGLCITGCTILQSRSVRDFDHHATRVVGKFETVDTYYRTSTSAKFVGNVSVPLLCISALDDPVCTSEAIPWDECRANENIILATTKHGGHLAFYEGITATSLWWVRAVGEFLGVLHCSPHIHKTKVARCATSTNPLESSINQGPYLSIAEDGLVTTGNEFPAADTMQQTAADRDIHANNENEDHTDLQQSGVMDQGQNAAKELSNRNLSEVVAPLKRSVDQLSRRSGKSIWLLAYIAVVTSWPLVGPVLLLALKKRFKSFPAVLFRR